MWVKSRTETVKAVPVDVALGSFRVDVLTVGKVETAVIVLGVVSAVGSGSSVVSCQFQIGICKFNMDTGCVELLLREGRMISIDCTGVEDALDVTMAQQTELDYLIYNDPLGYADLILNGDPKE